MIKSMTINFETNEAAQNFATAWGRATLTGNCQSALKKDGSRDVTVYDVCKDKSEWISSFLNMDIPKSKSKLTNEELLQELGL